ncbi:CHAT domain-containing protein [Oscillatoria sp. FACHB-1407]|uniref:CHAT domain-containing protein n=1 Tax=Oscillatoria sp. FACHB-1407 TaxID=2692847 RepID=UPI0016844159|nr:CHAT domain-containing protein [Oscillatoria sp. FACHB-1407]MBD2465650.1 CHAT domain-containing protein [Oscillatoria sp. FACHB-1407]
MIQEFYISVTPLGEERYLVRTERVASGVPLAEEQVKWTVEEWLSQARYLMNDPLLGLLHGTHRIGGFELPEGAKDASPTDQAPITLVDLGQQLYSALFQGRLRDSWMTAQGIAQHKGEILRLRLGLKGSRLLRLPWEVMYGSVDPSSSRSRYSDGLSPAPRPIAAGTDVIFSRYQPGSSLTGNTLAVEPDQPLRILMAIATPSDQERLELKREAEQLQQELRGQMAEGSAGKTLDIQLTVLQQPGREQLTQELEQGQYHVFHYAGHSNLGAAGGALYLVNPRTGLTETLSGDDLAGLLVNNHIRMAVFNSCRGAHTPDTTVDIDSPERNLAEALVSRGIPAVLAMAERIPDEVALNLTRLFYRNLKQGYPIDRSLSRARQGLITSYGSQQLYWALPVLYMHADFDGYLTAGDRTVDTPSDRLLVMPAPNLPVPDVVYRGEPATPTLNPKVTTPPLESEDDLDMITRAVLDDDDLSDIGYDLVTQNGLNGFEVDPDETYQRDVAVVADLIEQLSQQNSDETIAPARTPLLSRESSIAGLALADDLPEIPPAPPYQPDYVPADLSKAAIAKPLTPSPQPSWWQNRYLLLPLAGIVGTMAIGFAVMRFAPDLLNRQPDITASPTVSPIPIPSATSFDTDFFAKADTVTLTEVAISRFSNNDLDVGQQAVTALLERGAIQEAASALEAVPNNELERPEVNFLRGRLAWEQIKRGEDDFSLSDVIRFWDRAVKADPDVPQYQTALGFAYYADGNLKQAIATLCQALDTSAGGNTSDCSIPNPPISDQETLNAIAVLALAYKQGSEHNKLDTDPEEAMSQALRFYQIVMSSDPMDFNPNELGKTWLWTESAVNEWRSLATR